MGNDGAHSVGMKEAPLSIMESVNKQVEIVSHSSRALAARYVMLSISSRVEANVAALFLD